jgi:hypothetical protein
MGDVLCAVVLFVGFVGDVAARYALRTFSTTVCSRSTV